MNPLVTLDELKARIEWTLDADEERLATGTLEDLSDDARYHGSIAWLGPESAPRQVKSLVLRATARFLRNPDGYTTSRAGDETLAWTDRGADAGTATFTASEVKMLRQIGGTTAIMSVPLQAWGSGPIENLGTVPVDYSPHADPVQMFETTGGPW